MDKYMPRSLRDCLMDQFSRFDQGSITVAEHWLIFMNWIGMRILFLILTMREFLVVLIVGILSIHPIASKST